MIIFVQLKSTFIYKKYICEASCCTEHKLFASFLHVNPISQILVINMYTEADSMID